MPNVMVPPVSMISSVIITVFPFTDPIIFMTSATFGSGRRLSIIAIDAPKRFASSLALVTPSKIW